MSASERMWPRFHVPVDRSGGVRAHPTAIKVRAKAAGGQDRPGELDAAWLRALCLDAGADDAGFAALDAPGLEGERDYVQEALPGTRSLIAFCVRTSRDNLRSRSISVSNRDFATTQELVHETARHICLELQRKGIRALYPATGFPMEVHRFPGRTWVVSHKLAAVAAGLGQMGVHRNVIHPRFGTFLVLGTILLDAGITPYSEPLAWNPCLDCGLCVAACPVGAIHPDGEFDFDACPAGEDVLGPYLEDQDRHEREFLRPLREKPEYVYVKAGSAAEAYVCEHFPHKTIRHARAGTAPAPEPGPDPAPARESG